MGLIRSISFNQDEILQNIVFLHTGPPECDVTYGRGGFYHRLPRPRLCFDLEPLQPEVTQADVRRLPLGDNSLANVFFDPPFLLKSGSHSIMKERFGKIDGQFKDLLGFYYLAMLELHRVLRPGGWLVYKCQDMVSSGVNNFSHVEIYAMARTLGFVPKDLFILLARSRMISPLHKVQVHCRKFHSYFWVFRKKGK
jgi:hypothetical protein